MARQSLRQLSGYTILVVDDQEEMLESARMLLGREGHRVLTATSGAQALAMLKGAEVHVLIVDYLMPRMNGADLIREVRRFDPIVQIILQTGYADERPPRVMLAELDIQGYHDKSDGPDRLLVWVDVAIKAYKLLKQVSDRERMHAELVANCSHEFRSPLNIIIGWADALLEGDLGELSAEATRSIRSIDRAARTLSGVVVDYLQHAKLEAHMECVGAEAVDVAELALEMKQFASLLLDGRDIEFAVDVSAAPRCLTTDATKLETIVRNLVTNAAKFTTSGRIGLSIRERDDVVQIDVSDTGCGIREEDRELIFEAFRQGEGGSQREQAGIGLGLALARRLAQMLGGELLFESELGRGSVFKLLLPASPAAATMPGTMCEPARRRQRASEPDDEEDGRVHVEDEL